MSDGNVVPGNSAGLETDFRKAWSRFATGVTVITTVEPDGSTHGMTANGVTSVSLTPPLSLASIGHERNTYRLIRQTGRFGLSILASDQRPAAAYYALPPERREPGTRFDFSKLGGSPVLTGALAAMDCRVIAAHEAGDHTIFIGKVEYVALRNGEPLLWFSGAFGVMQRSAGNLG